MSMGPVVPGPVAGWAGVGGVGAFGLGFGFGCPLLAVGVLLPKSFPFRSGSELAKPLGGFWPGWWQIGCPWDLWGHNPLWRFLQGSWSQDCWNIDWREWSHYSLSVPCVHWIASCSNGLTCPLASISEALFLPKSLGQSLQTSPLGPSRKPFGFPRSLPRWLHGFSSGLWTIGWQGPSCVQWSSWLLLFRQHHLHHCWDRGLQSMSHTSRRRCWGVFCPCPSHVGWGFWPSSIFLGMLLIFRFWAFWSFRGWCSWSLRVVKVVLHLVTLLCQHLYLLVFLCILLFEDCYLTWFFHYQAGIASCSGLGLCANVFIFQPFLALSKTYSYCGRSVPIWIFWQCWGGSCWNLTLCSGSSSICCNSYCLYQKASDCCLLEGNCLAMGFRLGSP